MVLKYCYLFVYLMILLSLLFCFERLVLFIVDYTHLLGEDGDITEATFALDIRHQFVCHMDGVCVGCWKNRSMLLQ